MNNSQSKHHDIFQIVSVTPISFVIVTVCMRLILFNVKNYFTVFNIVLFMSSVLCWALKWYVLWKINLSTICFSLFRALQAIKSPLLFHKEIGANVSGIRTRTVIIVFDPQLYPHTDLKISSPRPSPKAVTSAIRNRTLSTEWEAIIQRT